MTAVVNAQSSVVVVDPRVGVSASDAGRQATDKVVIERDAIPKLRTKYASDACTVEPEFAGEAKGSFTRVGAKQTVAFYQVCQTGNGLGVVAIVISENGEVVGIFGSDSGWTFDVAALRDINRNGLDEFTLSYGGGMHQGQGGVGVDVMECASGMPRGLGWFKAEEFMDTEAVNVWLVTAKPAKTPRFYKQKYTFAGENKWRRVGDKTTFRLAQTSAKYEDLRYNSHGKFGDAGIRR